MTPPSSSRAGEGGLGNQNPCGIPVPSLCLGSFSRGRVRPERGGSSSLLHSGAPEPPA